MEARGQGEQGRQGQAVPSAVPNESPSVPARSRSDPSLVRFRDRGGLRGFPGDTKSEEGSGLSNYFSESGALSSILVNLGMDAMPSASTQ